MPPPILLLKTESTPSDPYATLLASHGYDPIFVPVLHHTAVNGDAVKEYILDGAVTGTTTMNNDDNTKDGDETQRKSKKKFAAIIITSQRAVESLGSILQELNSTHPSLVSSFLATATIYVVGPATRNSLLSLGFPPSHVIGEDSGNGAVLADFIMNHYVENGYDGDLLFLTGETHSTILPTRVPERLKEIIGREVEVEEVVVYKTGVMESFEDDLKSCLDRLSQSQSRSDGELQPTWLIFFSPTGTDAALRVLSSFSPTHSQTKKYKCCSIGPTTRDFMFQKFGRKADAMAKIPSPEGVLEAIRGG
ncbi:uncharacterized protein DFL_000332 [Arthrobotrys flagrans]|uniref:Tetrapyrrole biosynthesis uroporphyrinogen III synthase domain-containing protein n=1 Tax=Arthrobotrys flagrans TaxID=97331 RepID=A0A437ADF8_ARTFL|nr:hypothetical protein DFL_000332 [Arthrobotrys flagrans]